MAPVLVPLEEPESATGVLVVGAGGVVTGVDNGVLVGAAVDDGEVDGAGVPAITPCATMGSNVFPVKLTFIYAQSGTTTLEGIGIGNVASEGLSQFIDQVVQF
jgi:hypothetical protein